MDHIHKRIIAASKLARAVDSINLCTAFKSHPLQEIEPGMDCEDRDIRVNIWLFEQEAYRSIRAFKERDASDLPNPALNYRSYELGCALLHDLANSDNNYGTKVGYFCIFDTIKWCNDNGLEVEPENLAQAQFAAISWTDEAREIGINQPEMDFILALWNEWADSYFPKEEEGAINSEDYWDHQTYFDLADYFCNEIAKRNQFTLNARFNGNIGVKLPTEQNHQQKPFSIAPPKNTAPTDLSSKIILNDFQEDDSVIATLMVALAEEKQKHAACQAALAEEKNRSEEFFTKLSEVQQVRDSLIKQLRDAAPAEVDNGCAWVSTFRKSSRGFDALLRVIESELLVIQPGRRPKKGHLQSRLIDECRALGVNIGEAADEEKTIRKAQGIISLTYPDNIT